MRTQEVLRPIGDGAGDGAGRAAEAEERAAQWQAGQHGDQVLEVGELVQHKQSHHAVTQQAGADEPLATPGQRGRGDGGGSHGARGEAHVDGVGPAVAEPNGDQ